MSRGVGRALARYREIVVGQPGWGPLLRYELLHGLLGPLPGALGLALRGRLYRRILGAAGRGLVIGRSVTLRGPGNLLLEDGVTLDEHVEISARGAGARVRIGAGTMISRGTIMHTRGGVIDIGAESSLGTHCRLGTTGEIRIGRYALFAAGCMIGGEEHPSDDPSIPMVKRPAASKGGVIIDEDVWLGLRTIVLDGVRIGRGCIIGAGAVVTRDIPEFSVAVGAPARVIRERIPASSGPESP